MSLLLLFEDGGGIAPNGATFQLSAEVATIVGNTPIVGAEATIGLAADQTSLTYHAPATVNLSPADALLSMSAEASALTSYVIKVFPFPYHRQKTTFPPTGLNVSFGKGWSHATAPDGPYQMMFKLSFKSMKYFVGQNGYPDAGPEPEINMFNMIEFYREHLLHKEFLYNHPVFGQRTVKFAKPLDEPEGIENGNGATNPFDIYLIDIPKSLS